MKHTYISAAVMFALGSGVFLVSEAYQPQQTAVLAEAVPDLTEDETEASPAPSPDTAETDAEEEPFVPSPTTLNLIHSFPEGADSSDLTKSYGGEAFRILMTQDETWMSGIYDYSDYAPIALASRLGRSREQVMGRYNPKDSTHDPNDPDTWTINSFKEIRMQVTDGDGNPISVYSNVIEIMSMANVYTWYQNPQDYDLFLNYAKGLWQASHSYSVSMSDVYYCSGCMDEEAEARERERLEAAARAEEQGLITEEGIEADSLQDSEDFAGADSSASPVILSNHGKKESAADPSQASGSSSGTSEETVDPYETEKSTSGVITAGQSRQTAAEGTSEASEAAAGAGGSSDAAKHSDESGSLSVEDNSETASDGLSASDNLETASGSLNAADNLETAADGSGAMGAPEAAAGSGTAEISDEASDSSDASGVSGAAGESASGQNFSGQEEGLGETVSDTDSASETSGENPGQAEEGTATASDASRQSSGQKNDCPGHIDLIIKMKICGLDDEKGLYSLDSTGNDPSNITENGWQGWTEEAREYVSQLSSQDWFRNYGLSVSVISMLNPLTGSEIEAYLEKLPASLSPERRSVIEFALASVGKVPYYWGGKASHPDYDGNGFGTLVSPDTKGRVLKGLDCSGWISWVYWSATGERLPYESTSGLAVCGTRIGREQLQPGDIIVRTGADAHVIMFLGWTEGGRILCIHESSAGVNNVTVAVRDANWPYYRKLLD